jgi:hypothetical protein
MICVFINHLVHNFCHWVSSWFLKIIIALRSCFMWESNFQFGNGGKYKTLVPAAYKISLVILEDISRPATGDFTRL